MTGGGGAHAAKLSEFGKRCGAFETPIALRSSDGESALGLCASPRGRTRCGTIQVSSETGLRP